MKKFLWLVLAAVVLLSSLVTVSAGNLGQSELGAPEAIAQTGSLNDIVDDYFNVSSYKSVEMNYDDRKDLDSVVNRNSYYYNDDYVFVAVVDQDVNSYKVSNGAMSEELDDAVVTVDEDTKAIATGVGTASLLFVNRYDLNKAKDILGDDIYVYNAANKSIAGVGVLPTEAYYPTEPPMESTEPPMEPTEAPMEPTEAPMEPTEAPARPTAPPYTEAYTPTEAYTEPPSGYPQEPSSAPLDKIDAIMVNVTVKPAKLTVAYVAGQSNAAGYNPVDGEYEPQNSVLCQKGQVYTTYAPNNEKGAWVTGITDMPACTVENAEDFVAGSLGNDNIYAVNGNELVYKLDALTKDGLGKSGFDAAFAYEWNKLTKDKVWVVNAAYGGTNISHWQEGAEAYERAMAVFGASEKTLDAEVSSGHYELNKKLSLWMQGEGDYKTEFEVYHEGFKNVVNAFNSSFDLDCFGVIPARANVEKPGNGTKDLTLTAPRLSQSILCNSQDYPNVYMLSTVNEDWVTDEGVKEYFDSSMLFEGGSYFSPRYESNLPLRDNCTFYGDTPTTAEEIYSGVHFSQIAHNEMGIDIARNYYRLCNNNSAGSSFDIITQNGERVTDCYENNGTNEFSLVLRTYLPYMSKSYTLSCDENDIIYDAEHGTFKPQKKGTSSINVLSAGDIVHTVEVVATYDAKTPQIKSITNTIDGPELTWDAIDGAYKYKIFYHNGKKWISLGTTSKTSFTHKDASSGVTYRYTVRCVAKSGIYQSDYNSAGWYHRYLATPKNIKLTNTCFHFTLSAVKITFDPVQGADRYMVYYKEKGIDKDWQFLDYTYGDTYLYHHNAESSKTYYYTVQAVTSEYDYYYDEYIIKESSAFDKTGKSITYVESPVIKSIENTNNGPVLTWDEVPGAYKYRAFYHNGKKWVSIGTVSGTSITHKKAKASTEYRYTVRCVAKSGKYQSGYYSTGWNNRYLTAPKITKIINDTVQDDANGYGMVKITFNPVAGAKYYRVYYREKGSTADWQRVVDLTDQTTVYHRAYSGLDSGKTYVYTVRCMNYDGEYYGPYDYDAYNKATFASDFVRAGTAHTFIDTPRISSIENTNSGPKLTWERVPGAYKYRAFYHNGKKWVSLGTTSGTSLTHKNAKASTEYRYTVRCVAKSGSYQSGYFKNHWRNTYYTAPVISKLTNTEDGIKITFKPVKGAYAYRVYFRVHGTKSWTTIEDAEYTQYTTVFFEKGLSGEKYDFTVRCMSRYNFAYASDYIREGKTITCYDTPQIKSATKAEKGYTLEWDKVDGASKYQVMVSTDSGWKKVAITSSTKYTVKDAKAGDIYTVVCMSKDGKTKISGYNTQGFVIE